MFRNTFAYILLASFILASQLPQQIQEPQAYTAQLIQQIQGQQAFTSQLIQQIQGQQAFTSQLILQIQGQQASNPQPTQTIQVQHHLAPQNCDVYSSTIGFFQDKPEIQVKIGLKEIPSPLQKVPEQQITPILSNPNALIKTATTNKIIQQKLESEIFPTIILECDSISSTEEENAKIITKNTRQKLLNIAKKAYLILKNVVNADSSFISTDVFAATKRKMDNKLIYVENAFAETFTNEEILKLNYLMNEILELIIKNVFEPGFVEKCIYFKDWWKNMQELYKYKEKYLNIIIDKADDLYTIRARDRIRYWGILNSDKDEY